MEGLLISIIYIYLLVAHYISDFLFQTRKMGEGKSTSIKLLTEHVLVYTSMILLVCSPAVLFFGKVIIYWALVNGVLHWITDYFTSRASKRAYDRGDLKSFWWIIGLDQLIHGICLFITFGLMVL